MIVVQSFTRCKPLLRVLALMLGLSLIPIHGSASTTELVFGLYTADKPSTLVKAYRPILTAIEKDLAIALGSPVSIKLQIARSYEEGIDALIEGKVDFSMLGPASYIEAKAIDHGLRILALDSKDGSKVFYGVICVSEDSPVTAIEDLQGRSFAFGNTGSTIGRYLSQAYLSEQGVSASNLSKYAYLGRHDRVGHAVAQGSFDAGALKEGTFEKLVKKGSPLRVLARFPNVNKPWVAKSGMDRELFDALQQAMFELDAPKAFKVLGRKMFVAGDDSDFTAVRNAINNNFRFFTPTVKIDTVLLDSE